MEVRGADALDAALRAGASAGSRAIDFRRRAALYVDKILKGAKLGDLPIEQPTRFALVINMKAAKALGLTIPQSLLLHADEVIGFLNGASPDPSAHLLAAFRQGLSEAGFDEGRNVAIEYRWAEGRNERLPELAKELVRRQVAVLVAGGGAALAAKAATATIPIVFNVGGDPVALGLVASLNRPGGNLTGVTGFATLLEAKRMGLLRELVPSARAIAVLVNPTNANVQAQLRDTEDSARRAGVRLIALSAKVESDFETAFVTLVQQHADALLIGSDPFFTNRRDRLVALAARHKLPTIYEFREFAAAGGLMSYGTNRADGNRQVGVYTGRILKGAKPGDLPVLQPTKFELVINLKTAKSLGIAIPQSLLLRADEVIQ